VPDLDRAVEAQLEHFHPSTAPAFDALLGRRRRQDVRHRALGAAAAVALGATALGVGPALLGRAAPDERPAAPVPAVGAPAPDLWPSSLAGSWRVSGAGEGPDAVLRLSPGHVTLSRPCGDMSGGWSAGPDGLFVGRIDGADGACVRGEPAGGSFPGSWLGDVAGFRTDGERHVLLDAQDRPVVTLLPLDEAQASFSRRSRSADWAALDAVPVVPGPGLQPVAPGQLPGLWVPQGGSRLTPGFLRFSGDRSWKASGGCVTLRGRWSAGEQGRIETVGPSVVPAVGCFHPSEVADGLLRADRLALDGDVLVLLDTAGSPTGRLERAAEQ